MFKFEVDLFYRNKACLTFVNRKEIVQATFMSILDSGDIIYMHAAASTLKPLDVVFYCALGFITGYGSRTHHCVLYQWVGPLECKERAAFFCVYLQSTHIETSYVSSSLIQFRLPNDQTWSQAWIKLEASLVFTELGKTDFSFCCNVYVEQLPELSEMRCSCQPWSDQSHDRRPIC